MSGNKKSWKEAISNGLISGSFASVFSTIALSKMGKVEAGDKYGPTNAISHWLWGDAAASKDGFQAKYSIPGFIIHHVSAVFWAVLFEKRCGHVMDKSNAEKMATSAVVTTAIACFVDYKLTPHRLQPGYEMRLSKPALTVVYATFALGLGLGTILLRNSRKN